MDMGHHVVELNLRSCFNQFHFESNALLLRTGIHRKLWNLIHSLSFVFFLPLDSYNLEKLIALFQNWQVYINWFLSFSKKQPRFIPSFIVGKVSFSIKKDSLLKSVGFSFRKNGNRDSFDGSFVNNNF